MGSPQWVHPLLPQLSPSSRPHVHLADEVCPYCDQPIPNEKAEQVRARAKAKERELSEILTARLTQKFALEKAQMEASAKTRVDQARSEGATAFEKLKSEIASKEATAREEGKKAAEAMLQERLTEQERTSQAQVATLQERLGEAERGKQEAPSQVEALKAAHDSEMHQRVQEVRDALEADKINALNAERAKHFGETQKLSSKLEDVTRQLEKKTANENLGKVRKSISSKRSRASLKGTISAGLEKVSRAPTSFTRSSTTTNCL